MNERTPNKDAAMMSRRLYREHYRPSRASAWTWLEVIVIIVGMAAVLGAALTGHTLNFRVG